MNLKEIIGEGDTASAVMFWTHLYLNELGLNTVQTMSWLKRCHDITAVIKTQEDERGTLVEIVWNGNRTKLEVYVSYMRSLACTKFSTALAEYADAHGGVITLPTRLMTLFREAG